MTREELKEHCKKQIEMCEFWAISKGEKPSGKVYEEHKLILELLEQEPVLDKIRAEIETEKLEDSPNFCVKAHNNAVDRILQIIDKYKAESEE